MCWHSAIDLCEVCVRSDPQAAAGPIPFEDSGRGSVTGFFATIAAAFAPVKTAPAFAGPGLKRAALFAVLLGLPLGAVRGIIPYTHTMRFGPVFHIEVLGSPSGAEIVMDVAMAMGLSLLITLACALALAVPFVSLARAYGSQPTGQPALRLMLYRGWLLTVSSQGAFYWLLAWALPEHPPDALLLVIHMLDLVPLLLLLMAMRATARLAHGVGPGWSFVTVFVPVVLMVLVQPLLVHGLEPWLPEQQHAYPPAEPESEPEPEPVEPPQA